MKQQMKKFSNMLVYLFSGMTAETISCLIWLPIDVIKVSMTTASCPPRILF